MNTSDWGVDSGVDTPTPYKPNIPHCTRHIAPLSLPPSLSRNNSQPCLEKELRDCRVCSAYGIATAVDASSANKFTATSLLLRQGSQGNNGRQAQGSGQEEAHVSKCSRWSPVSRWTYSSSVEGQAVPRSLPARSLSRNSLKL